MISKRNEKEKDTCSEKYSTFPCGVFHSQINCSPIRGLSGFFLFLF